MKQNQNIGGESSIVLYTSEDNRVQLSVKLENETVWLTQVQMAELFGRDATVIGKHIRNVYAEGELTPDTTTAKFAAVVRRGFRGEVEDVLDHYNLDVIISVGYRVKSKQGVRFLQWSNSVLKDYIIKGYAVRDNLQLQHYNELKDIVALMARTMALQEQTNGDEYTGLFNVISDYVYALDTLDHYDYQELTIDKTTREERFHATYENAMDAINRLKEKFGGSALFANEKDESFRSSIGQIYQTFGGEELYQRI